MSGWTGVQRREATPDTSTPSRAPTEAPSTRTLRVGAANDPAEAEADRVAEQIVAALNSPGPQAPVATRVARAHAPVVRRKLAFTSKSFQSTTSLTADVKGVFGQKSTFAKIKEALDQYHKASDPVVELHLLQQIDALSESWLKEHTGKTDDPRKRQELTSLRNQLAPEMTALEAKLQRSLPASNPKAQQEYMQQIDESRQGDRGFQYLTDIGLGTADWMRWATDSTQQQPDLLKVVPQSVLQSKNKALTDTMTKYGLTQAEATAIGVYTAQDYLYINPVVAGSDPWLESQLLSPALGPKNTVTKKMLGNARDNGASLDTEKDIAKAEGAQHANVALQGLAKLDKFTGTTYRGKGMTKAELQALSKPGAVWKETAFASTSQRRAKAEEFASKVSGGKVGALMVFKLRAGRDVAPLSFADEAEVLVLPGATFRVTRVTTEKAGGKKLTVIYADQVS